MSVQQRSYLGGVAARATASDRALLQPTRFVGMPMRDESALRTEVSRPEVAVEPDTVAAQGGAARAASQTRAPTPPSSRGSQDTLKPTWDGAPPTKPTPVERVPPRNDRTSMPTSAPTGQAQSPTRRNAETVFARPLGELALRAAVMPGEEDARAPRAASSQRSSTSVAASRVEPNETPTGEASHGVAPPPGVAPSSSAPPATRHAGERSSRPFAPPYPTPPYPTPPRSAAPRSAAPREAVHQALLAAFSWTATSSQVAPAPTASQPAPDRVAVTLPVPEAATRGAAPAVVDGRRTAAVAPVHAATTLAAPPRAAFEPRAAEVHIGSIEVELVSPPVPPPPPPRSVARAPGATPARLARDFSSCFGFRQR